MASLTGNSEPNNPHTFRLRIVKVTPSSYSTQGCSNRHIAETKAFTEQSPPL
ncbi:hypothetical protein H6F44_01690 [Pseudanabaena sp. FACHB-1277]|uniref:Uncharacterized protein n=1 Tax=Pseudanabaena cinerea FACHB-1277 TaxID=2949581 RepID=A0A926UQE8_9CYAN|nr:hypothetical protein [Pseudanabaena cinerea]MBD2148843.1 hypothetical protein [Pseudanabaena cinerea FACHB-1277]